MNELLDLGNTLLDDLDLTMKRISFNDETLTIWQWEEIENLEIIEWKYYRIEHCLIRRRNNIFSKFNASDFEITLFKETNSILFRVKLGNEQIRGYRSLQWGGQNDKNRGSIKGSV